MEAQTIAIRDGDVYRWYFHSPDPDGDRSYGRYHCCSNIAIGNGGRLYDTFWQSGNDRRSFGADDLPRLKLTFLGNLSDYQMASESQADYYDDSDFMDLNHSNSPRNNFYLKKGAERSQTKMLDAARRKLEMAESDERMAAGRAARLREAIANIEFGRLNVHLF